MRKLACIFPGQGSQEVGMASALLGERLSARVFEDAESALGFPLRRLMMEGPQEELTLTYNAQPAILTVSIAVWQHLDQALGPNRRPSFVAGHSLGEFSALTAAGAIGLKDAVKLVRRRGELMQSEVPAGFGTMAALIGGTDEGAWALVAEVAENEILDVANFNAPGQVVISGHTGAVKRAIERSKDFGFRKAVELNVSAPFHSRLMEPVRVKFAAELARYSFSEPECPVIHNVDALPNADPAGFPDRLARQIDSPVRWVECVEYMLSEGVEVIVEVGYGSVLQGLVKKIVPKEWDGRIIGCAKAEDVINVLEAVS